MKRQGQLGAMIALSVMVLIVVAILFGYAYNQASVNVQQATGRNTNFEAVVSDATNYVQDCLAMNTAPLINELMIHGGRTDPSPPAQSIYFNGTPVHTFCEYKQGDGCVNTLTTRESLEREIVDSLNDKLPDCTDLANQLKATGAEFKFLINPAKIYLNVSITPDNVRVRLDTPVKITLGTNQREVKSFSSTVEAPLGRLFGTALDVSNAIASTGFFDKDLYMTNHDSRVLITVHKPYPDNVYQISMPDNKTGGLYLFQFATRGEKTVGQYVLKLNATNGCCYTPDGTCHTNTVNSTCAAFGGRYENLLRNNILPTTSPYYLKATTLCSCPSQTPPEEEGCCVSASDCSIGSASDCSAIGGTFTPGDRICAKANCPSLDCKNTFNMATLRHDGPTRKNGESWCVYEGRIGTGNDEVGSRHYVYSCVRGKEQVEPCRDYREEMCIEGKTVGLNRAGTGEPYKTAVCKINRWWDCTNPAGACEDSSVRDCTSVSNKYLGRNCVPKTAPGLPFWNPNFARICQKTLDGTSPPSTRRRTYLAESTIACLRTADCGIKDNILKVRTDGGYFNPDGNAGSSLSSSRSYSYPGLPGHPTAQSIASTAQNSLDEPGWGSGYATCGLWTAPSSTTSPSGNCALCSVYPLHPCSEYRCRSIGKNCFWEEDKGVGSCVDHPVPAPAPPVINLNLYDPAPLQGNIVNITPHQAGHLSISADQDVRCKLTIIPGGNTVSSSGWYSLPTTPPVSIKNQVYLTGGNFSQNHNAEFRLFDKYEVIDKDLTLRSIIPGLRMTSWDAYVVCNNRDGIDSVPSTIKFSVPSFANYTNITNRIGPSVIEVTPPPEAIASSTLATRSTQPVTIYSDRPFDYCTWTPPGGAPSPSVSFSCLRTTEREAVYITGQPIGSYPCSSQIELSQGPHAFQCFFQGKTNQTYIWTLS